MKRVCTICARGGSKGIPNKNLKVLHGRPLVAHSVQHALDSALFDAIAVSSDSDEILQAALEAGATLAVPRPVALATDASDKSPAILHCGREAERLLGQTFDTFVDLDATAPLRLASHIRGAVTLVESGGASNVLTVCPSRRNPYFNMVEVGADGVVRLCKTIDPPPVRRQDTPVTYDMNASIYVWSRRSFFEGEAAVLMPGTQVYVMPEYTAFDMDSLFDFRMIEFIYPQMDHLANDTD